MKDVMGAGRINNDEKKRRGLHLFLTASIAGTSTSGGCGILGISRATIVVRRSIIIRIVVASVDVRIVIRRTTARVGSSWSVGVYSWERTRKRGKSLH
mmetsp:Transcript_18789/g.27835  ORF Transcript_18789/g.27835 Transcript_18789/m.27835 type:complete len:98 (-) Transcript_18789:318-611(-)